MIMNFVDLDVTGYSVNDTLAALGSGDLDG